MAELAERHRSARFFLFPVAEAVAAALALRLVVELLEETAVLLVRTETRRSRQTSARAAEAGLVMVVPRRRLGRSPGKRARMEREVPERLAQRESADLAAAAIC